MVNADKEDTVKSVGTIKLGEEKFALKECIIWGYLGQRDGKWYCRWCIDAEGGNRRFTADDDSESYEYEVHPSLSANTVPIEVASWRELDGKAFTTGEHGEANFFDTDAHSATYTLRTMTSHELCSNNFVKLQHEADKQFRVHWTGESYLHGVDGSRFELDAVASLTSVSVSSEVETVSDVNDGEIGRTFAAVFPKGDFDQQPAKIDRIDEDGLVTLTFKAEFTPK